MKSIRLVEVLSAFAVSMLFISACSNEESADVLTEVFSEEEYQIYSQYFSASFIDNFIVDQETSTEIVLDALTAQYIEATIANNPFQDAELLRELKTVDRTSRALEDKFTQKFKEVTLISREERESIFESGMDSASDWEEFEAIYGETWIYTLSNIAFSGDGNKAIFCLVSESEQGTFATAILMVKINEVWIYDDFESIITE